MPSKASSTHRRPLARQPAVVAVGGQGLDVHRISHASASRGKVERGGGGRRRQRRLRRSIWKSADAGATDPAAVEHGRVLLQRHRLLRRDLVCRRRRGLCPRRLDRPGRQGLRHQRRQELRSPTRVDDGAGEPDGGECSRSRALAGARRSPAAFRPLLALHSTDGGKTWANETTASRADDHRDVVPFGGARLRHHGERLSGLQLLEYK